MQISRILASRNLPQTLPKSSQNRRPKQLVIFLQFSSVFFDLLQKPNLKIHAPTQCFVSFSHKSVLAFRMHLGSEKHTKNLAKTIPKQPKNRIRKQSFFQYGFFMVSASILEGLSVQMDGKTATKGRPFLSKRLLDLTCGHL